MPACATGEEAYSIAMLLLEHAETLDMPPELQVFACDLDDSAVRVARARHYPESIAADVSEERLRRFFVKGHNGYRVRRELRETVLFATHDTLEDAPFSRMDLISCRNPLAPISNSIQILRLCLGDDAEFGGLCEMMERQVQLMVRLVDDLLEVSRVTRGAIELRDEPTDLASVLKDAVELSRPLMGSLGHRLEIALPEEPIPLRCDVIRLGQVFGNLLTNAAKYTEPGGEIRLEADRSGDEVVIRVRDNGIGIAPEMLPQVFEMFTQVDRASNRARGGLGIGLTLAKQLVQLHGGSIAARSEGLGKGSQFTVRLPVGHARDATPEQEPAGPAVTRLSRRRILVVDDNVDSADSLARLLKSMGIDVQTAHEGPTALEILGLSRSDVVFLDLGLPGMDGVEAARRIREDRALDGVRLIALTGWGQASDRSRTQEAGFDHHLVKPTNVQELHSLLA